MIHRCGSATQLAGVSRLAEYWKADLFDRLVEKEIRRCDILHIFAGFGLRSIRKAKDLGSITLVDRASSHAEYQEEILREEYQRCGLRYVRKCKGMLERELQEYEEADFVLVPSQFAWQSFREKGFPEKKLIKVPFGIDHDRFRKIPKADNIFRVLFVGGFSPRKGPHYLLQAFSELSLPSAELCVIGRFSRDLKSLLNRYRGRFRYAGPLPHDQLYRWYSQASVFVLPSVEEGFAYVIGEAMACGLPVIATDHTGGSEIIREGQDGFVIPIRDVEALKEKILRLYENPSERERMSLNAMRQSKQFTWERYGDELIRIYDSLLGREKLVSGR
jgi:glycosyltransferase involved in cell wall biosynthesis